MKDNAWFDVNGTIGRSCRGDGDFESAAERLDFMDRLGVARALVWNREALHHHPLPCNGALLEELRRTPCARDRLFPVLAFSGLLLLERNGVALLKSQLKAAAVRALRFVNFGGRHTLLHAAPLIERLRSLHPLLLVDAGDTSEGDLLEFAAAFPRLTIVLTRVQWPACAEVFALMRRRPNICCDTSWLHSFRALELATREFGAERLLFGLGPRSHNGAALGALARADLTPTQRRTIAHGNLDGLTGLNPTPARAAQWTANTLWPRFLAGEPLGVAVADAHGHFGPSAGYALGEQQEGEQLRVGQELLSRLGFDLLLVSGLRALLGDPLAGNAELEKFLRPHSERFGAYVAFNPFFGDALAQRFEDYFQSPVFRGFKTLCDYWKVPIGDARFQPMWEFAHRRRLPVLCHTWSGSYDSPALFRAAARRYPRAPILLGHSGGDDRGRPEAEALAAEFPNVYLEWCGSFYSRVRWEDTLRRVPLRRVVFGTDAFMHDPRWELARLLSLELPDDTLKPVLGANLRRLLAGREKAR